MRLSSVVVFVLVGASVACTPTWEESIAKNRANADTYRQVLGGVAGAIDAAPPPAEAAHCKPPKPLGYSPQGAGHTTELYLYEDLRTGGDPASPRSGPRSTSRERRRCTGSLPTRIRARSSQPPS